MKDKNGIEICCENCDDFIPVGRNGRGCSLYEEGCENVFGEKRCTFRASSKAYEARIADLQNELYVAQESERAEAQEADRLRAEVKELGTKLTETIKLLSERSRECGKLEALLEVKNRSDISTQSTGADDVSKKIRETDSQIYGGGKKNYRKDK